MKLEEDIYKNKYNVRNAHFEITGMQSKIIHPFTFVKSNIKIVQIETCVIAIIVVDHS